jgi:hypothetical protein
MLYMLERDDDSKKCHPVLGRGARDLQPLTYRAPGLKSWFDQVDASGALITTNG